MIKRLYHTVTVIAVSSSQVVVVVFGGMYQYVIGKSDLKQSMRSDTNLLEFGNYIIVIVGAHSHTLN